ncbi:DedA family protein [Salinisphaera sp. USBA-960]|uniref:DedA family protein n=1 Tax=Salinisphaera orenii TaxID=856731 RepID=UPI000DBE8527|nr:DedA family protein [Salifodinibacter halophilus]NNC27066.1 DedA family protein [Salifodinibacter halophilus]
MLSTIAQFVIQYGYIAVGIGCFFEGEIAVFAGMIAAREGALMVQGVFWAALVATFIGDNVWFQVGRVFGRPALVRRPRYRRKIARVEYLVDRYGAPVIIGFRFFYGLRYVTPFVLASLGIPTWRFALYDAAGVLLWTAVISVAAYYLAGAAEQALGWIQHAEIGLLATLAAGVLIAAIAVWLIRRRRRR